MELNELFEKVKVLRELASMDITLLDRKFRAGMEGKIRSAQSEVQKVEEDYKNKVVRDCVIIAVTGKYGKDFALISESFKTLPLDFLHAIDVIGDSIIKRGGKNQYTSHEHLMVMDELNKIKMNYKISQLPMYQAKHNGIGPNTTIKEALYTQLTDQYGGQLYSAVTRGDIGNSALKIGFTGKTLPVVLYNYAVGLDSSMLPSPLDIIAVNEIPTKEDVKSALMKARSKISKN